MQELETNLLKVNLIFLHEIKNFSSEYFFLKTDNHQYSFFFNHKETLLSLINSEIEFYLKEELVYKIERVDGLLTFKNNIATFFIKNGK